MGTDALDAPGIASSISAAIDVTAKKMSLKLIFNESRPTYTFLRSSLTADGGILITFSEATPNVAAGTAQSFSIPLAAGTNATYVELVLGNGKPNPRLIVKTSIPF